MGVEVGGEAEPTVRVHLHVRRKARWLLSVVSRDGECREDAVSCRHLLRIASLVADGQGDHPSRAVRRCFRPHERARAVHRGAAVAASNLLREQHHVDEDTHEASHRPSESGQLQCFGAEETTRHPVLGELRVDALPLQPDSGRELSPGRDFGAHPERPPTQAVVAAGIERCRGRHSRGDSAAGQADRCRHTRRVLGRQPFEYRGRAVDSIIIAVVKLT